MANAPSAEEAIALVKTLMDHPAVMRMFELDTRGHTGGLGSDHRAKIVNEISTFYMKTETLADSREFVVRVSGILRRDAVDEMLELGKWATSKAIAQDACKAVVSAIIVFYANVPSPDKLDLAADYVKQAAGIVADIGPSVLKTLREPKEAK